MRTLGSHIKIECIIILLTEIISEMRNRFLDHIFSGSDNDLHVDHRNKVNKDITHAN